jgi:L1 cell adhesion molecule like protein
MFSEPSVQCDSKLYLFKAVAGRREKPMIMVNYKGKEKQFICQDEGYR